MDNDQKGLKNGHSLMEQKYLLPSDYATNERVRSLTLEEVDMEQIQARMYK
jgi:hypothetical protein